jgi:hypothetical protein
MRRDVAESLNQALTELLAAADAATAWRNLASEDADCNASAIIAADRIPHVRQIGHYGIF